jgi:hypothetical protein
VKVQAILYDCDDNIIDSELKSIEALASCVPGNRFVNLTFHFSVCNGIPRRLEIRAFDSLGEADASCDVGWSATGANGIPFSQELPLPAFDCGLTKRQLDCLACDPKPQPLHGVLSVYKQEERLYSLPADDGAGGQYGEVVNGRFDIPGEGVLYVEALGWTGAGDVYGGQDGWQHRPAPGGDGRHGEVVGAATCIDAVGPDPSDWQFNVRTYRGSAPDFRLAFTWYQWHTNDQGEECCVLSQEEVIGLPIKPLPCLPSAIEPAVPALRKWPASHEHFEMRLPCCGTCDTAGGACSGPGMTDWFVVWPSETDGVVRYGPARGWRVDAGGDALWSPGADGLKYQFSDQHD